ncbi:MAG: ATP-binding protein [Thioalkalivibrio sp.]|jgi:hypothetical protein|nr:ATP-binding protein [Thioalkalivibrio sp.]
MNTYMADVTIHIDEETEHDERERIQDGLREMEGVMAASSHDDRPHLMVVEFDPERVATHQLLERVTHSGLHAELVGL